jgi:plasmid stability protein
MGTMTIRELPEDLQAFLKADAQANHRSVNKQVIVALDEYRQARLTQLQQVPRQKTPEEKMADIQKILDQARPNIIFDPRTDDEIIGYNAHGHFD